MVGHVEWGVSGGEVVGGGVGSVRVVGWACGLGGVGGRVS